MTLGVASEEEMLHSVQKVGDWMVDAVAPTSLPEGRWG